VVRLIFLVLSLFFLIFYVRGLRAYRCLAIKFVIEWQGEGEADVRSSKQALLLTAACAWILNGIHSTPDMGASSRDLMNAILPHVDREGADVNILAYGTPVDEDEDVSDIDTEDDDDGPPPAKRRRDALTLPAIPWGLLFHRDIRLGLNHPVPRFVEEGDFISEKTFMYFFKVAPKNIDNLIVDATLCAPVHPARIMNRRQRTTTFAPADEPRELFKLRNKGLVLRPRDHDSGSDIETSSDSGSGDDSEFERARQQQRLHRLLPNSTIDQELTFLWRQFLLDLTSVSPNIKGSANPSYCKLTKPQRLLVNESTYRNEKLSDYFIDVQWKIVEQTKWDTNFKYFFPDPDSQLPAKAQGWKQCQYFQKWQSMMQRADDRTIDRMRSAMKTRFDTLYWVPRAEKERIWSTKRVQTFEKPNPNNRAAAPQVFVRSSRPQW
jgi:hypothetical protein